MSGLLAPLLAACVALAGGDGGEAAVRYEVTLEPEPPRWRVEATIPRAEPGPLEFWLPRWTAGAYHLADYGQFVESLVARDEEGDALPVERDGPCRFVIDAGATREVVLDYVARPCAQGDINESMILQVEGNRIASDHAFVSPNSLLGFAAGLQERPCEVRYRLPPGWRQACVLPQRADGTLLAPSWWRLEDSPALFSPSQRTLPFDVGGVPHAVTLHGGDERLAQRLAEKCRALAAAGSDWMQGLPYDAYHFLVAVVRGESGGAGLEHAASTLIVVDPSLAATRELDHLLAHEYFHLWCAERIQVAALVRPDYTRPLRTGTIWVNEGLTEYFCRHLLVRAGLRSRKEFFAELSQVGREARLLLPMAGGASWTESSRAAADWDDLGDLTAFSVKHYLAGCWTAFALDLDLRAASAGERGVADLLRYLHHAHGARGRGFGEEELPAIVAGIAQADLDDFFARYVDGPELPELRERLAAIGYTTQGGLQEIVPLPGATPAQLAAREDFFSLPAARAAGR